MRVGKYIFIASAVMSCAVAFAQEKKIDTLEFNVVSKYRPVITDAVKLNDNPAIADTIKPKRKAEYNNLVNTQFPTYYTPDAIDAIRMKGEPLEKLYRSYLALGGGNYNTLYGEYFFNCLRSKDFDYGIHLNHLSSDATLSNSGYAGYAYNDINLWGDTYFQNHILYGQLDFDNHGVNDYGYNPAENTITNRYAFYQAFNNIGGSLDFKSDYKDSTGLINHDINVAYYNFDDYYSSSENNFTIKAHAFTYYDKQRIDIKLIADYHNEKSAKQDTLSTLNLGINPYFTANGKHWDARLGLKVYYDAQNKFTPLPDFKAKYHFADDAVTIYAGIDGDKTFNGYKALAAMNPFIQDTVNMKYTITPVHFFGGVAGYITPQITYNASAFWSEIKEMPLFVTDTLELFQNRFAVVYDNVKEINGHLDVSYLMKDNIKFTLSGDYYNYTPMDQLKVWYHPNMQISLLGNYVYQKFTFRAAFYYLGVQYAPISVDGQVAAKQINGYPDLNVGCDFHCNRLLTAFVNLNNLANVSYQRWLNYPTQGFNAMVGVKLAF
jgi:hypothetical protein